MVSCYGMDHPITNTSFFCEEEQSAGAVCRGGGRNSSWSCLHSIWKLAIGKLTFNLVFGEFLFISGADVVTNINVCVNKRGSEWVEHLTTVLYKYWFPLVRNDGRTCYCLWLWPFFALGDDRWLAWNEFTLPGVLACVIPLTVGLAERIYNTKDNVTSGWFIWQMSDCLWCARACAGGRQCLSAQECECA